jgi:uncharacterized protein (TIGR03000 family)
VIYEPYYVSVPTAPTVIVPSYTYAAPAAVQGDVVVSSTSRAIAPAPNGTARAVANGNGNGRQPARIEVLVPEPNADVWFGDFKTSSRGNKRVFETPALALGKNYTYRINARWDEGGRVRQEQVALQVTPGGTSVLDFSKVARPAEPAGERIPPPPPAPANDLPPE